MLQALHVQSSPARSPAPGYAWRVAIVGLGLAVGLLGGTQPVCGQSASREYSGNQTAQRPLGQAAASGQIQWLRSAEQAAEVAAQTGKPILIYARSSTCHYCDLMQRNVWENPTASTAVVRDFVPLKLTREDNPEAMKVLKIKGYPSTIVFTADRAYIGRIDGYVAAEEFLTAMGRAKLAKSPIALQR